MTDLKALLRKPAATKVNVYVEHADGSRNKIKEPDSLDAGREYLKKWSSNWVAQGPRRSVTVIDDMTVALRVQHPNTKAWQTAALAYIDPLPDRSKHKGDLRIDRSVEKRKPIR